MLFGEERKRSAGSHFCLHTTDKELRGEEKVAEETSSAKKDNEAD